MSSGTFWCSLFWAPQHELRQRLPATLGAIGREREGGEVERFKGGGCFFLTNDLRNIFFNQLLITVVFFGFKKHEFSGGGCNLFPRIMEVENHPKWKVHLILEIHTEPWLWEEGYWSKAWSLILLYRFVLNCLNLPICIDDVMRHFSMISFLTD